MKPSANTRVFQLLALALLVPLSACADRPPLSPPTERDVRAEHQKRRSDSEQDRALAELRRATARYHNVDAALADGYVKVEDCEEVPGEGSVGTIFAKLELIDGTIDTSHPEALLYEPAKNGKLKLVGVELVIPVAIWSEPQPPEFLGNPFLVEGDVYGLHVWIWRNNPNGMFAAGNPRVSC